MRALTGHRKCRYLLGFCLLQVLMARSEPITYHYRVIAEFPQDTGVFTQGLVYRGGNLYESAGQYGESRVLIRTLDNAVPTQQHRLPDALFGEGITVFDGKIYQLTWRSRRAFIYDQKTLEPLGEFAITGEGWGITNNDHHLIVSNGSDRLTFIDPASFETVKTLGVHLNGHPVQQLNELEWIKGKLYANIWRTNWIIIINPDSGVVEGRIRLHDLLPDKLRTFKTDVLNGIAYDSEGERLLVTGKYWPRLYHIELFPARRSALSPAEATEPSARAR